MRRLVARLGWGWFAVAVGVVFVLGAALRVWLLVEAPPAFIGYPDSGTYVVAAATRLFGNEFQPVGYSLFLRAAHVFSVRLTFTAAVQHGLGVATAGCYLAALRRAASVVWVALLPAAFVLFDGTQLFFEHAVMSEVLLVFLLAVAMYAAVRGQGGRWLPWTLLMAIALSLAVMVRAVSLPLVVVGALWLLLASRDSSRRLLPALVTVVVGLTLVGLYVVRAHSQTGVWGVTRADGFNPYLRVASFADCSQWEPPAGTRGLCARRVPPPSSRRTGPFLWACWVAPGLCSFGNPRDANAKLGAFARAAILNQPGDYLSAVGRDFVRFITPPSGASQGDLLHLLQSPLWEQANIRQMASYYSERAVVHATSSPPVAYGLAVHTTGAVIAILIAGGLLSIPLCRGRERTVAVLFTATGLVVLIASVATATYQPRYAIPALAPLSAATALALSGAIIRAQNHRRPAQA